MQVVIVNAGGLCRYGLVAGPSVRETAQYRNGLVRYGYGLVAGPSVCETAQYRNGLVRWCGSSGGLNVGSRKAVRHLGRNVELVRLGGRLAVRHLGRNGVLVRFEGRP